MQRLIITFLFIQFLFLQQNAQQRVSDIQDIVPTNSFTNYFHTIANEKYLIQMSDVETRISIIDNDSIQLKHQLYYRPLDEHKTYVSDPCHYSRPLVFQDSLLIEFYSQSIYISNMLNGELVKIFDLRDENIITYASDLQFFDNKLFFYARKSGTGILYCYIDLLDYQFFLSDFFVSNDKIRLDDKIYKFHKYDIYSFDISNSNDSTLYVEQSRTIDYLQPFYSDCEKKIVFGNHDIADYYVINNDHSLISLGCNLEGNIFNFYMKDSIVSYTHLIDNDAYLQIYDIKNCRPIQLNLDKGNYKVYDIKGLSSEFILFSNVGDYFTLGDHFLVNTKSGERHYLSSFSDAFYEYNMEFHDGTIYIVGVDDIELYGFRYSLNAIDLKKMTASEIATITDDDTGNIILSPFKGDQMHVITTSFMNKVDIFSYLHKSNLAIKIKSLMVIKNAGIRSMYETQLVNDKLFFSIQNGIYVTDNDVTSKLFDCTYTSGFILYNNYLYALVKLINKEVGYIKINVENHDIFYKKMPNISDIDYYNEVTDYVIINERFKDVSGNFLFDVRTEKYEKFTPAVGNPYFSIRGKSGNNLLISNYGNSFQNRYYHIYDIANKSQLYLQKLDNQSFKSYADGKGGFIILQDTGGQVVLKTIDKNGSYKSFFNLPSAPEYQVISDIGLDGEIQTLPIQGYDSIIFVSIKNDEAIKTSIPYYRPLYYRPFFWKEVGDMLVTEVFDEEGKNHQYVRKYGEEPILIPSNINHLTIESAIIDGDDIILFLENIHSKELKIIHYNYATKEIINILERPASFINYYAVSNIQSKIADDKYLISFNDGIYGRELWVYDKVQHSFELYEDIKSGYISSTPENFTEIGDYIYLIARDNDDSRQWFRIQRDITNVEEEVYAKQSETLVFPNPAINTIGFKKEFKDVELLNEQGKLVMTLKDVEINKIYTMENLAPGFYIVKALYENKLYFDKLILCND